MAPVRPRRQPQRTCVSCRETQDKRALVRIVRLAGAAPRPEGHDVIGDDAGGAESAAGRVAVDETGRASGRGAYLCTRPECWRRALRAGSLARALKTSLLPADRRAIEEYADHLEARRDEPPANRNADSGASNPSAGPRSAGAPTEGTQP